MSKLEGRIGAWVLNNEKWIRYPITWPDGSVLKGKRKILNANTVTLDKMKEGRYVFGANKLFVYQALDRILKDLEIMLPSGVMDELYDRLEESQE